MFCKYKPHQTHSAGALSHSIGSDIPTDENKARMAKTI